MQLALFDFDGTITHKDSLLKFIKYSCGDFKAICGMFYLAPLIIAYKLKLISNHSAKQSVLRYFFQGMDEHMFNNLSKEFSLNQIRTILRQQAMEKISWHRDQGHKVVVVSASIENWLKPWCDINKLDLIATKLEIKNGIVTGRFQTKNCFGKEKLVRVKEKYNLDEYDHIYAYGDSKGDLYLMEIAHTKNFRTFN